ncbi:MAG: histidine kinase [Oscillatoria sp. SIO1A7]|nr:histidine kinase [Oscillatoria sp. SIO1A7]
MSFEFVLRRRDARATVNLVPLSPCPLVPQCPMPHAQCPMPNAQFKT